MPAVAIAKWSLGLFLLRIIVKKYQRIAIWFMMISLLFISLGTSVLFWTQSLPPSSIFDKRIRGRRIFPMDPFLKFFGSEYIGIPHLILPMTSKPGEEMLTARHWPPGRTAWGVTSDLLFCILPWVAFKSLNMGKRKKYTVAGSLSLGFM